MEVVIAETPRLSSGGDLVAQLQSARVESSGASRDCGDLHQLLRSIIIGGADYLLFVSGESYGARVPRFGTSSLVSDERPVERRNEQTARVPSVYRQLLALPIADQLREALAALSINKSQLAEVLCVSRPTLYDWLDGKEPNPANAQRLSTLLRLLAQADVTGSRPLNARFVQRPLSEAGMSILDALKSAEWREDQVESMLLEARSLGGQMQSRRLEREDRLRALGYEDQSAEQRRDQLAHSIAAMDWSKR